MFLRGAAKPLFVRSLKGSCNTEFIRRFVGSTEVNKGQNHMQDRNMTVDFSDLDWEYIFLSKYNGCRKYSDTMYFCDMLKYETPHWEKYNQLLHGMLLPW